jgi:hypothetical protein
MVMPVDDSLRDRRSTRREEIQKEITSAQKALEDQNEGKARVCARRAVGNAFRLSNHSMEVLQSIGANEILKIIAADEMFSEGVRNAARRLAASVNEGDISLRPVDDALLIIEELLLGSQ